MGINKNYLIMINKILEKTRVNEWSKENRERRREVSEEKRKWKKR